MGQTPSSPSSSTAPQASASLQQPLTASSSEPPTACPVNPQSREAWLRAAQAQNPQQTTPPPHDVALPPPSQPVAPHPIPAGADAAACPVDHKSREAWLKAAQAQGQQAGAGTAAPPFKPRLTNSRLSTHREVSTIPRAFPNETINANAATIAATPTSNTSISTSTSPTSSSPSAHGAAVITTTSSTPASPNAQTPSPNDIHTSPTGHWVYPSERMFYTAMQRKNHTPNPSDMSSIIPIHNAVNERTWAEVLKWERGWGGEACGGPKLVSFEGDASKLTPRARWRGWLGYQRPFDRHDWVVERCGTRVEYVIDFYEGKKADTFAAGAGAGTGAGAGASTVAGAGVAGRVGANGDAPLSFYLDVRPKLNSWEGVKMRAVRFWGWG